MPVVLEKRDLIPYLFLAAGVANLNVLLFSWGFSNESLMAAFPEAFSRIGLFTIVLWGLAYMSVANRYADVPWLVAVFAVEKYFYAGTWLYWYQSRGDSLGSLFDQSMFTGIFYSVYGANDLAFGLVFTLAFFKAMRLKRPSGLQAGPLGA
jgi:hypothetical protein